MNLLRQILATLVFLVIVGAVWLRFDPAPGAYLLADNSPLPAAMRGVVSSLSPADDTPRVGATRRDGPGSSVPLVTVDRTSEDTTRDRLQAIATGEAKRSVAVYPEATGIVTEVAFEAGTQVAAGDVLLRLEDDTERLAVDRARIALEAANAQVQRFVTLSSSVSAVQLDEARRAADNAALDLRAAEIALRRRTVVAPIDGRVGLSPLEIGALVGNQTLVATIDDREELRVIFNAPEGFASAIRQGHPVVATPTTRSGRVYEGEVTALDSRIDEASRTLRVEATIDNTSDDLRPGMSFSVELGFAGDRYLSILPLSVQWERAGSYVWRVEGTTVGKAPIRIVERNIDRVLVASDVLEANDLVVVEGAQQVRDGIEVRFTEPVAPAAAEGLPSADADGVALPAANGPDTARAPPRGAGTDAVRLARTGSGAQR